MEVDRHDDAIAACERALARNSAHVTAWNNLGLALTGCNRLPEAIAALRKAISLRPDFGEAHWNLALALLAYGDFAEGWREYHWRRSLPQLAGGATIPATPLWKGEDIAGKTLLLVAEQGLGDTLLFARFAATIASRGARVLVQAPRQLTRLIATVPGVADISVAGDPFPSHDVHIPLPSVPGALGIDAKNIPATVPYVRADDHRRRSVADEALRIAGRARKVGIAWAGARRNANDHRRWCPLASLAPLFETEGIAWFSLQKGEGEEEISAIANASRLATLDARNDFDGTAALVAAMDLVISVDTSIAHLSGALARPTWILLAFAPDWRWQTAGSESRWYPTARLFRQSSRGNWPSVVARVRSSLAEWIGQR